ncbi:MAG: HAMP domain-containing histidine kinase [Firmicutes bacterium]|nr:HAMP domain-containing histidine kinase [Bacillota bacterium]
MKYNIVFKFLAIALCALMLLGAAGSAAAIIGMTESGLYDISVEELRDRYIRSDGESMAGRIAVDYAEANLGGVPEAIAGPTVYDLGPSGKTGWLYGVFNPALAGYVLKDAEGNVLESGGAENLTGAEFYSFPVSGSYKYVLSVTEKSEATPQADASTYNAIPEGGALVLSLSIETEGSSGSVDSVEPIGNIYDTGNGVRFEANPSMGVIDLPDAPTTCVTFVGVDGSVLYQTYNDVSDCFSENESGYLVFDTTRELSQSEVLMDDVPTEGAYIYQVTFTTESELAGEGEHTCSGSSPAGVGEFEWDANGTAVVFRVTPSLTQKVMPETLPETTTETVPETTDETTVAVTVPETTAETVPDTTEETAPLETLSANPTKPAVIGTAAPDVIFADGEAHTMEYWDDDAQKSMVVEYRYAQLPDYTVELTLAPGAYRFDGGYALLTQVWSCRNSLFFIMGACLLLFAVLAVYLCCAAGRKPGSEEVHAAGFNCIPLDIYLAGGGLIIFGLFMVIVQFNDAAGLFTQNIQTLCTGMLMAGYAMSLIFVSFCFACAAQFKTPGGYWWRNSVCWRCLDLLVKCVKGCFSGCGWLLRKLPKAAAVFWDFLLMLLTPLRWLWTQIKRTCAKIGKSVNRVYSMMPLTWQWLLTGFIMVMLLFAALAGRSNLMVVLSLCACVAVVLYGAYCFGILLESAKRMGKGDLDTKVDDKYLTGAFKSFAGDLNDLAGVAVVAAQKQLKSERMKTELITNVSHDIKTPLTSIINYVDLLQKPHTPEEEKTYLEVLNRQSQRLKKLIEDLMEMSKASTGNLTADITKLDAVESVNQALGEFADKLEKAQLTPVFRHPEESVAMMADGRLAWRVLSNLLSNTVKYALPGTRVYIDVMALEGKVIISLKNISRDELNVDADELMERFVRGDDSRNTEGSGLGLNIVKTLMELQKGQLQLLVDGDLFKVTLIFPGATE